MKLLSKTQARELGCKRYYTGEPCTICGQCAPRLVNAKANNCCYCVKLKRDKHYAKHPERVKNRIAKTKAKNLDDFNEAKTRAREKVSARNRWAQVQAHSLLYHGSTAEKEIEKLDKLIKDDCQLACNIRDLKALRKVLAETMPTPEKPDVS